MVSLSKFNLIISLTFGFLAMPVFARSYLRFQLGGSFDGVVFRSRVACTFTLVVVASSSKFAVFYENCLPVCVRVSILEALVDTKQLSNARRSSAAHTDT